MKYDVRKLILLCSMLIGCYFLLSASYIHAKAILAQYLIKAAWQQSLYTGEKQPPWPWADTYPVAKLAIANEELYVLAGITGRSLAFGPGHMLSTPLPAQTGNTVIAGHRDTHFAMLEQLSLQQAIVLTTKSGRYHYQVSDIRIVHESGIEVTAPSINNQLTLITCYPFDALIPNTPWRYVITASQQ